MGAHITRVCSVRANAQVDVDKVWHQAFSVSSMPSDNDEEDPWDVRIAATGCYEENEALQLCHADTGDWRKCLKEMEAFRECWKRHGNVERVHTHDISPEDDC